MNSKQEQIYAENILKAQQLINDMPLCVKFQDKKFVEILEDFANATKHIEIAAIALAAITLQYQREKDAVRIKE